MYPEIVGKVTFRLTQSIIGESELRSSSVHKSLSQLLEMKKQMKSETVLEGLCSWSLLYSYQQIFLTMRYLKFSNNRFSRPFEKT